jgi:hypothetical protein
VSASAYLPLPPLRLRLLQPQLEGLELSLHPLSLDPLESSLCRGAERQPGREHVRVSRRGVKVQHQSRKHVRVTWGVGSSSPTRALLPWWIKSQEFSASMARLTSSIRAGTLLSSRRSVATVVAR